MGSNESDLKKHANQSKVKAKVRAFRVSEGIALVRWGRGGRPTTKVGILGTFWLGRCPCSPGPAFGTEGGVGRVGGWSWRGTARAAWGWQGGLYR